MSVGNEQQQTEWFSFEPGANVPIAQLTPDTDQVDRFHVAATIALIWPYSSSTQRISLLLAEEDVRLRKSKGQVKVTFHGAGAREIAKTRPGIGDNIKLSLESAAWTRTGEEVSTPGRKVDWDLDFTKRIKLEVQRGNSEAVAINYTAQSLPHVPLKRSVVELEGPKTNGFIDIRKTRLSGSNYSPARRTPERVSSKSFVDASLDPFADDDGYVSGRDRKRTKFSRHSGSWQLVDREEPMPIESDQIPPSSPLAQHYSQVNESTVPDTLAQTADQESTIVHENVSTSNDPRSPALPQQLDPTTREALQVDLTTEQHRAGTQNKPAAIMGPPPLPVPVVQQVVARPSLQIPDQAALMPTPVLRPLPSPGLALVSPLIERFSHSTSYFDMTTNRPSERITIDQTTIVPPADADLGTIPIDSSVYVPDTITNTESQVQASQVDVDETELERELLNKESETFIVNSGSTPSNSVQISATTVDRAESVGKDVDLDALQQQIEDSNDHWQESIEASVVEDNDMYGPPVVSQAKIPVKNMTKMEDNAMDIGDTISDTTGLQYPDEQSEVAQAPLLEHPALSQLQSDLQEAAGSPSAPVLIDSSSGEEEEDTGHPDVESHRDDTSEVSSDDYSEEQDLNDLERRLERELGDEDSDEGVSQIDYEQAALAVDALRAGSSSSVTESVMVSSFVHPPHDRGTTRTDGTEELHEDEDHRIHLRSQQIAMGNTAEEAAEIISSDSEISSSLSDRDVSELDTSNELDPTLIVTEARQVRAESRDEIIEDQPIHATDMLQREASPADPIALLIGTEQVPMSSPPHSLPVHEKQDVKQIITPDATQRSIEIVDEPLPVFTEVQAVMPPSPQQTQDQVQVSLPASPNNADLPDADHKAESEVPQTGHEDEVREPPKSSQRLSRKSFAGGKISTEYFTPRRSQRINPVSPMHAPEILSAGVSATSPRRSQRILRSSSPMIARQNEESVLQTPKLPKGSSTPLSYFPYLSTIHEYFKLQVDIIAVCTADSVPPQKAKAGPKDYYTTLHLTDSSFVEGNPTITAQFLRPRKAALPTSKRGDIVLLRNMKVQTHEHKVTLISTDSSAWAIFKQSSGAITDTVISGPPLEYDEPEETIAGRVLNWWLTDGEKRYPDLASVTGNEYDMEETTLNTPMIRRSQRRKANTTDNVSNASEQEPSARSDGPEPVDLPSDRTEPAQRPESSSPPTTAGPLPTSPAGDASSPVKAGQHQGTRRGSGGRSGSVVHELRDGTKYVDNHGRRRSTSIVHQLRDGSTYVDD